MRVEPRHYPLVAVALTALLYLPTLGSFGLWDPWEIKVADPARTLVECHASKAEAPGGQERAYTFGQIRELKARRGKDVTCGSFKDVTHRGRFRSRPPLQTWLTALGIRFFGLNEMGARLPGALMALLTVFLVASYGGRLVGPRAGLIGGVVLTTMPLFFLSARQVLGSSAGEAALAAALLGLGCYLWPHDGRRRSSDLAVGTAGVFFSLLALGPLIGLVLPLAVVGTAVALGRHYRAAGGDGAGAEGSDDGEPLEGVGPDVEPGAPFLSKLSLTPLAVAAGALVAAYLVIYLLSKDLAQALLTLHPRRSGKETFDYFIKQVGFGLFPWTALLVPAVGRLLVAQGSDEPLGRRTWGKLLLVLWVGLAYALASFHARRYGPLLFPAIAGIALAIGIFIDDALATATEKLAPERLPGLMAGALLVILALDFKHQPAALMGVHLQKLLKPYPKGVEPFNVVALFTLIAVAVVVIWLLWPRRFEVDPGGWLARVAIGERATRIGALAFLGLGVLFAGVMIMRQVPKLSRHLSHKSVFETYRARRHGDESLSQYRVSSGGVLYYGDRALKTLSGESSLVKELKKSERAFVMLPADQIGSIHAALRRNQTPYCVLDASNSRVYLASNRCDGEDKNPLKRSVKTTPPRPRHRVSANFEDKIELLGVDIDPVIRRGRKIKVTVHYKVKARVGGNYKVFMHFDGPAHRFHGDHVPLEERYPTSQWGAGEYISDTHEVDVPFMTTPAGRYHVYTGFFAGSRRLKVLKGGIGKENKVLLRRIVIR